jgi:hypothetical protein
MNRLLDSTWGPADRVYRAASYYVAYELGTEISKPPGLSFKLDALLGVHARASRVAAEIRLLVILSPKGHRFRTPGASVALGTPALGHAWSALCSDDYCTYTIICAASIWSAIHTDRPLASAPTMRDGVRSPKISRRYVVARIEVRGRLMALWFGGFDHYPRGRRTDASWPAFCRPCIRYRCSTLGPKSIRFR